MKAGDRVKVRSDILASARGLVGTVVSVAGDHPDDLGVVVRFDTPPDGTDPEWVMRRSELEPIANEIEG